MQKYVVGVVLSLPMFVPHAESQQPKFVVEQIQALQVAADREAASNLTPHDVQERMQRQQTANAVAERQSQLRRDTEKLVALAAELKQRVDSTASGILSMEVIKKAQEIQKLAKSVQDKMKNAY